MIGFRVAGVPAPKGSTKAFVVRRRGGRLGAAVTEDNPNTRPWAALVRDGARQACARLNVNGGFGPGRWGDASAIIYVRPTSVALALEFIMPRAVRLPKRRELAHTVKPDLDKLCRSIKDALTGIAWEDDAQVVAITASKRYALAGEVPGVIVLVRSSDATRLRVELCNEPESAAR